jgi:hypothetical protein
MGPSDGWLHAQYHQAGAALELLSTKRELRTRREPGTDVSFPPISAIERCAAGLGHLQPPRAAVLAGQGSQIWSAEPTPQRGFL